MKYDSSASGNGKNELRNTIKRANGSENAGHKSQNQPLMGLVNCQGQLKKNPRTERM